MLIDKLHAVAKSISSPCKEGVVLNCVGLIIEVKCPLAFIGEQCRIYSSAGTIILSEVVGFRGNSVLLMPFDTVIGVSRGNKVIATGSLTEIMIDDQILGNVVDAFAKPLNSHSCEPLCGGISTTAPEINPLDRENIDFRLCTGIRVIDGLLTLGKGQRIGLFAGSGVGKSTLLSSLASNTSSDINVIALIGERGREVKEFVTQSLSNGKLKDSVIICSTAENTPLNRIQATKTALAVAEYFASKGKNVLLSMDSITRYALALREVGLSIGEPPTVKGYTPSVFTELPKLIERCGSFSSGSITAIFTVLVESNDFNDPIVDTVRAVLDGHIVLSQDLAENNHFPAIDISKSISRLFNKLNTKKDIEFASRIRNIFSNYMKNQEIIELGLFENSDGSEREQLKKQWESVKVFLTQESDEFENWEETRLKMKTII